LLDAGLLAAKADICLFEELVEGHDDPPVEQSAEYREGHAPRLATSDRSSVIASEKGRMQMEPVKTFVHILKNGSSRDGWWCRR
jgi:hypothetical protein